MTEDRCARCDSPELEVQLNRARARNKMLKRKLDDIEALIVRRLHSWSGEFYKEGEISASTKRKLNTKFGAVATVLGEVRQVIHGEQYAQDKREVQ